MTTVPMQTARALAKEAGSRREELTRIRRIPADLFQRAGEARLFRQMLPEAMGGLGLAPVDWFAIGVEMARLEPSFSWVVTQGAADMICYIAAGTRAFAVEFLANPLAYSASSYNPHGRMTPQDGGFLIEGNWGFCSGCHGSTWMGGYCDLPAAEGERQQGRYVLVPAGRARIVETWDVMGMIGTGSHSVVIDAQEVPADWAFDLQSPGPEDYGPVSAAAGNGYWPISTSVSAIQLGIARRALDELVALMPRKLDPHGAVPLAQNAHAQRELMRAEAEWLAARAGVQTALSVLWRDAARSRKVPHETLQRLALANMHAAATGTRIVEAVCDLVGTSVAPTKSIFGACLRDARTIGSHISVNPAKLETLARIRFGLTDQDSPF